MYKSSKEMPNLVSIVPQSCPDSTSYHWPQSALEADDVGLGIALHMDDQRIAWRSANSLELKMDREPLTLLLSVR